MGGRLASSADDSEGLENGYGLMKVGRVGPETSIIEF